MTIKELRSKYLEFFESKDHLRVKSGSLIPYDVTGRLDESLLFNGAGMVQFKPYFRGTAEPTHKRQTNCQKVMRTGDIEEVGDDSHLTFFEMLGNFSFGDYFKEDAIRYSWEFLTSKEWLGLDPQKLAFTVFENDEESYNLWSELFQSVGIDSSKKVFRLGEDTNTWPAGSFTAGPPGPCGTNTEMFYWTSDSPPPTGNYTAEDFVRDEKVGLWLEIWNDVFIQYEWQGELNEPSKPHLGYKKTGMPELPFRSVDTGMGLERTATALSGKHSVYDTDAFQPIFRKIEELSGKISYSSASEKEVKAMRIVADHLRATVFCIADGILPSNSGRGYVLRRLIRRSVLKGARDLGFSDLFLSQAVEAVIENCGYHYSELYDRKATIIETLKSEEAQFRKTLESGSQLLLEHLEELKASGSKELSGDFTFQLYDTFGFPLEVTEEIAAESDITIDKEAYEKAMADAQERSRQSSGMATVYGGVVTISFAQGNDGKPTPTNFLGYDQTECTAKIVGAHSIVDEGVVQPQFVLALDQTPFYAESGGQVSDTGIIKNSDFELKVIDITKQDGVSIHLVEAIRTTPSWVGESEEQANKILNDKFFNQEVIAQVDLRRKSIQKNHTATHILHAVLRSQLGEHVTQAGSLVDEHHLRFDFTHGSGLSDEEIRAIEDQVNQHILKAEDVVVYNDVPLEKAKQMGAMALFGEKYSDSVRVVQIGSMQPTESCYSRELCGGIHVKNTGEIGLFLIKSEASAASGIRRIVAITGEESLAYVREQQSLILDASHQLKSRPDQLIQSIEKLQDQYKEEKKKREKLAQQGGAGSAEKHEIGSVVFYVQQLEDADPADAKLMADKLIENSPAGIALVTNVSDGKVMFTCKVGSDAQSQGIKAGDLVREVAKITGGGGGGRPDFATAGGRDQSKLSDAINKAKDLVSLHSK